MATAPPLVTQHVLLIVRHVNTNTGLVGWTGLIDTWAAALAYKDYAYYSSAGDFHSLPATNFDVVTLYTPQQIRGLMVPIQLFPSSGASNGIQLTKGSSIIADVQMDFLSSVVDADLTQFVVLGSGVPPGTLVASYSEADSTITMSQGALLSLTDANIYLVPSLASVIDWLGQQTTGLAVPGCP